MFRILISIAFALLILSSVCPAGAQPSSPEPATIALQPRSPESAEAIIAHHVEALGGKEKLQGLNSIYMEGVAILPSGLEIHAKSWKVYDRLYRQELQFGEDHIVVIATPGKGWSAGPRTGGEFKPIPTEDLKALRVEIDPAGPLADYSAKGFKLERLGTDTIYGQPCYVVKVYCPSNHSITYSIDQNTWYVLRETRKGGGFTSCGAMIKGWNDSGDGTVTFDYSDYKKGPGGYILPYSITVHELGAKVSIEKVEINKNMDVDTLGRPGSR
ncbi:hypothetical protein [Puia dinghuensis]|uniref:DUF4292 domain-containing protein n=1 Tax=Puia dinghuensis TaxID=1792502 RepID=A0A8J2UIY0_9BACT|nr:hypothetical protein [Puia dinghuensis]GGB23178.1 hypothetical protein GCM10011511_53850 [Puia dinghuensis]